jgi:hypothetical protein
MIAEGCTIVNKTWPRLLTAPTKKIIVQPSFFHYGTSNRPLDAARFVRYLLTALPWAVTRGQKQPDAHEEVV